MGARTIALLMAITCGSVAASAQNSPQNSPAPQTIPGLDNFSLPPSRTPPPPDLPPIRPNPAPTPTPSPTPAPQSVQVPLVVPTRTTPTPRSTPAPRVGPSPSPLTVPRLGPAATPTPARAPEPSPAAVSPQRSPAPPAAVLPPVTAPNVAPIQPVPEPKPVPVTRQSAFGDRTTWFLIGGGVFALMILGALALVVRRRRHWAEDDEYPVRDTPHETFDLGVAPLDPAQLRKRPAVASEPTPTMEPLPFAPPPPSPAPTPPASVPEALPFERRPAPMAAPPPIAPASPVAARATLEIELSLKRAGTNLLSAAVEYDISVRNIGDATARAVRLDVRLLSASAQQDALLNSLFAAPIERPTVAPFDLPPGSAIELGGMAMLPKESLSVMTVAGRALFVPVLAINALYQWEGGAGQAARSYVIGIDRGAGAKLAPFRLDAAGRMHDAVSQLPYTVSVLA